APRSPSPATPLSSPRSTARPPSRRPTTRPGHLQRPAAPRPAFVAPPNMPMRRRRSPRRSMTAAIPPACCAGADDGKFLTKLDRLCHHDRGGLAVFPARRIRRGIRAVDVVLDIDVDVDVHIEFELQCQSAIGILHAAALPDRLGF